MAIPLEDNFDDIIGKALRGLELDEHRLAEEAGVSVDAVAALLSGKVDEATVRRVAGPLNLSEQALVDSALRAWNPNVTGPDGLQGFNTPYHDMRVNAYVVWDPEDRTAAVFDTGADADELLAAIDRMALRVAAVFLTHTHGDHVADLDRVKRETGAPAYVSEKETIGGAETFAAGQSFTIGSLSVETRQTFGHSAGGTTYLISGLDSPLAIVGDALFAGSMGGGRFSYRDALDTNRRHIMSLEDETIVCPGHGPLTTVGEEKRHNPFFPEFQQP